MNLNIYARVSTEDQNVIQQINFLMKWCKSNDHVIKSVVRDKESAAIPLSERKRFLKLLETCKTDDSDGILIINLDRLTRYWDDVTMIEKYFRDNWSKTKLISTSEEIDLSNASGRFIFRILMAKNCYMPEDMREKQKIGIARAKKENKFKGGTKGRTWKLKKKRKRK